MNNNNNNQLPILNIFIINNKYNFRPFLIQINN